jgi:hypothetical protein
MMIRWIWLLPSPISHDAILGMVRGFDVVSFHVVAEDERGRTSGWRSWVDPGGRVTVDRFAVSVTAAQRNVWESAALGDSDYGLQLAADLLPDELRDRLASHNSKSDLVICPDGALSRVPWPALEIATSHSPTKRVSLIEVADVAGREAGHAFEAGLAGERLFDIVESEAEVAREVNEREAIEVSGAIVLRQAALRGHAPT